MPPIAPSSTVRPAPLVGRGLSLTHEHVGTGRYGAILSVDPTGAVTVLTGVPDVCTPSNLMCSVTDPSSPALQDTGVSRCSLQLASALAKIFDRDVFLLREAAGLSLDFRLDEPPRLSAS